MALKIIAFDESEPMWKRLTSDWQEQRGALLFPGGFARQQFEKGLSATVLGSRIYTLPEFWQEVAKKLEVPPKALSSDLEEEAIGSLASQFERLLLLSGDSLSSLVAHLQKIEYEADRDFKATNDLEEEILLLRKKLEEKGLYTQATFRTLLSRRAEEVDLGYPLFVTHLPEPSRQLAGLLKGLAKENDLFFYPLLTREFLPSYLKRAGFSDYTLEENFTDRPLALLFSPETDHQEIQKEEASITLASSADEEDLALSLAAGLIEQGEERIALVVPGSDARRERLVRLAREHGLPLAFRRAAGARETLIGSLLLALVKNRENLEDAWEEIVEDASPLYRLGAEDLEGLLASEDFLADILRLGERLLMQDGLPAREHLWLANAWKKHQALLSEGIGSKSDEDFLLSVLTPRKSYGQGLLLLSPAEAPGYQLEHIIFLHLSADDYPGLPPASPFFSRELLAAVPALDRHDERYTFLSCMLTATKSITLLRDSKEEPSVYFSEVARLGFTEKYLESDLPGTTIKKMARERQEASEDIERALRNIAPEVDLEEEELRSKRDFSVTELERYLACPLGWFVENQIGPGKRVNLNQRRGTALHGVLEELLSHPPEERPGMLAEVLDKHTDSFLSPRQRAFDFKSLEYLLDTYSGPAWPFPEHHLEQFFVLEVETEEGDLAEIKGRIDRLDLRDGPEKKEALLIDYKLNKAGGGNLLQISLYPLMAEANLGVEALGFLYVSMSQGKHKGRLRRPIAGISEEGVEYPLKEEEGLLQAKQAIQGIRDGQWFRVGDNCPPWCAHRLLSKTKEIN